MIDCELFGALPDGTPVSAYRLTNHAGLELRVADYGATLLSLAVPDRAGCPENILLGFPTLEEYVADEHYLGSLIGRCANRIAFGKFALAGAQHSLEINAPPHHLHGGARGFGKRMWSSVVDGETVRMRLESADGDEGYPGAVVAEVTFSLTAANELVIDCRATTTRATPLSLTSHGYFNLRGEGDILGHQLTLGATHFTPVNEALIPSGEIASVVGTPFDFQAPTKIGARIADTDEQLLRAGGYDHNFALDGDVAARLEEPVNGRVMTMRTTAPGLQLYTGNFLAGARAPRSGLCLEPQHFPDAVNHSQFPSPILHPGQTYRNRTVYAFSAA